MIVDTSAVLAVLFGEPDAERYARAMAGASRCRMSVASLLEAAIVLESRSGAAGGHELDVFVERALIELAPVTAEHAQAARRALAAIRQRQPPGGTELRRLLRLRAGRSYSGTASVQGAGLRTDRHRGRITPRPINRLRVKSSRC